MKTVPRDKRRNCAMEKLFAGYVNARLDSCLITPKKQISFAKACKLLYNK